MSTDPMHTSGNLNWDPASVSLPEIPMLSPGEDAMSMTIAGVLPTLTAQMAASVAALQAKETNFSGKVGAADSAYQNADDSGGQSVGQLGQMLGQLGQMAQQAGGPAQQLGGQVGQFGSMMQQAMKGAQGGGSGSQGGGSSAAGGQPGGGQGSGGAGAPPQPARDDAPADGQDQPSDQKDRDERDKEIRGGRTPLDAAAPGAAPHRASPAPVAPLRHGDGDDLARRM